MPEKSSGVQKPYFKVVFHPKHKPTQFLIPVHSDPTYYPRLFITPFMIKERFLIDPISITYMLQPNSGLENCYEFYCKDKDIKKNLIWTILLLVRPIHYIEAVITIPGLGAQVGHSYFYIQHLLHMSLY
jgi:hypothetical protein